jgi:4-carboxymuconolactone decarboxylase
LLEVTASGDYERGMRVRREVLGDDRVDRAEAAKDEFNADIQDLITRVAWGEIWDRPGLDRRTRSLVTVAIMVTLRAEKEIAAHVAAALRNGDSPEELKEVILHSAIYAGFPAANSAFAIARRVLSESTPEDRPAV